VLFRILGYKAGESGRRSVGGRRAMTVREEVRLLSASDVLEPLSEAEIEELARRNPDTRLDAGQTLFTPEEDLERLFVLKEGRVQVYKTDAQGQEITLAVVRAGSVFGEMALTAQRLRDTYARAMEPSVVFSLRREDLEGLIRGNAEVGLRLVYWLSERLRQCEARLEDVTFKEMPARLASQILELIDEEGVATAEGYLVPTRYTHEQLASMIGANRVSVSRAFSELREGGIVESEGRHILVKDLDSLGRAAQEERRMRRIAESDRN
jgi:CRP/FNR family transcriptional regulator, cyclic AMP receptor protein